MEHYASVIDAIYPSLHPLRKCCASVGRGGRNEPAARLRPCGCHSSWWPAEWTPSGRPPTPSWTHFSGTRTGAHVEEVEEKGRGVHERRRRWPGATKGRSGY